MAAKKKSVKKQVKELSQTHGMKESFEATTLDQVWGDDGLGKYKTTDANEYEDQIKDMNKSDLQSHAQRLGLLPIDNRMELQGRLVREFKKHVSAYRKPSNPHSWATKKIDENKVRKLLSE